MQIDCLHAITWMERGAKEQHSNIIQNIHEIDLHV